MAVDNSTQGQPEHVCKFILYQEMFDTFRVRVWDVVILIPNLLFLIYLMFRFNRARLKLRATSSPIFLTFYVLVCVNVLMSIFRCLVSMSLTYNGFVVTYVDTILWVTVRFFLLSTEMSVVIFGLAFGHLDSRSSIRYVLTATSGLSLAFSLTQASLELLNPDPSFGRWFPGHQVFGHGGMLFWLVSSLLFTFVYLFILCLPWTRFRDRLALPTKRSFYVYICVLMFLNLAQATGALLLLQSVLEGICLVDITAALYFTFFVPLLYFTFLREFFVVSQPGISFSYNEHQADEDSVSLPHQQSFSSLKTDSDFIYQHTSGVGGGTMGGSIGGDNTTRFHHPVLATPINPLYTASLQSPDSITGYSLGSAMENR
uniref:Transmembrane protein adipocyte-associated 1 homolog n=1 Tax=Cacopsylla melanoneura TaxID=428564 RepID=A0A8D8TLX4_9HEMI